MYGWNIVKYVSMLIEYAGFIVSAVLIFKAYLSTLTMSTLINIIFYNDLDHVLSLMKELYITWRLILILRYLKCVLIPGQVVQVDQEITVLSHFFVTLHLNWTLLLFWNSKNKKQKLIKSCKAWKWDILYNFFTAYYFTDHIVSNMHISLSVNK